MNGERKRHRFSVEPLERRVLLSGSSPKHPIVVAEVAPSTPLTITAELASKSDADGNGITLRPTVTIVGRTVPGARVRLKLAVGGKLHRMAKANTHGKYHWFWTVIRRNST